MTYIDDLYQWYLDDCVRWNVEASSEVRYLRDYAKSLDEEKHFYVDQSARLAAELSITKAKLKSAQADYQVCRELLGVDDG